MNSVWHSLLWKEWREYRWKLAALTASLLFILLLLTFWTGGDSMLRFLQLMFGVLFSYGFLAGMFLGMGVAARENGVGTAAFLQSLPVPMWKAAAAKLLMASLAAILPIVLVTIIAYGCVRTGSFYYYPAEFGSKSTERIAAVELVWLSHWFLLFSMTAIFGTLSLLWWMAAIGANRSDEIRAGAIGFLGIVSIWFCLGYAFYLADKYQIPGHETALATLAPAAPGGPYCLPQQVPSRVPGLPNVGNSLTLFGLLSHAGVLGWFLYRFGRRAPKTGRAGDSFGLTAATGSQKAPFKSQLTAIAWKQMWETGPLAVMALAGILGMATLILWVDDSGTYTFKEAFLHVGAGMSFFVVLVAGIGIYLDDLKPGLSNFWRSRPTDLRLWFGIKYAAGILTLAIVLGIPMLVAGTIHWNEYAHPDQDNLWLGSLFVAWLSITVYSLAMTFQCLTRQPIYAAVLTLATLWLGGFVFAKLSDGEPHVSLAVTGMIVSLVVVVSLAWKTVQRDWGWKH